MSTKTIYKRIALVAVATLGAGVLSVAPASAALAEWTFTKAASTPTNPTVGSVVTIPLTAAMAANDTAATTMAVTATFVSVPANSALTAAANLVASTATSATAWGAGVGPVAVTAAANVLTAVAPNPAAAVTANTLGAWSFTPDVAGVYSVTLTGAAGAGTPTFATNVGTQNAKVAAITIVVGGASLTQAATGKGGIVGAAVAGGSAVANFHAPAGTAANTIFNIVSSGVGTVNNPIGCASLSVVVTAASPRCSGTTATGQTAVALNGVNFADGIRYTSPTAVVTNDELTGASATGQLSFDASSAVAGTQTITVTGISLATGIPTVVSTLTITWGAAPVVTAGTTTARVNAAGGLTADGSDTTIAVSRSLATQAANIVVSVRDGGGSALMGQTVSATISGSGLIGSSATATAGTGSARATSVALSASQNVASIHVNADGTAGTGTITILVGTTVVATKTVSFFGAPATITAVQNHRVLSSAGGAIGSNVANPSGADIANTPSVVLTVLDANGIRIPGLTTANISAVSSDATVMSTALNIQTNNGTGAANTVSNTYNVQVSSVAKASGSTATLTFRVALGTTPETFITATPLTYTLGGGVASVALSLDKATYSVGEAAVATLTLKDGSGNAAWDNSYANILTAALTSSLAVNKVLFGTAVSSLGGVSTVSLNAPATSIDAWTISGTTGTGPATAAEKGKALSASASVSNASADAAADAANEATDAANAATDAALAAADAADAATAAAQDAADAVAAATAAAQDAADAVAALSTRVSTLVSNLRKQITALTKLVQRLL